VGHLLADGRSVKNNSARRKGGAKAGDRHLFPLALVFCGGPLGFLLSGKHDRPAAQTEGRTGRCCNAPFQYCPRGEEARGVDNLYCTLRPHEITAKIQTKQILFERGLECRRDSLLNAVSAVSEAMNPSGCHVRTGERWLASVQSSGVDQAAEGAHFDGYGRHS